MFTVHLKEDKLTTMRALFLSDAVRLAGKYKDYTVQVVDDKTLLCVVTLLWRPVRKQYKVTWHER